MLLYTMASDEVKNLVKHVMYEKIIIMKTFNQSRLFDISKCS